MACTRSTSRAPEIPIPKAQLGRRWSKVCLPQREDVPALAKTGISMDGAAQSSASCIARRADARRHNAGMRRLAEPRDIEAVYAIYAHAEVVPFLTYEPMPLAAFAEVYADLLASGCFYVWQVDGDIAGFYRTARYPGRVQHVVRLGTLAVDPARHGMGVGRAMLLDAFARLRADGVRRVELFAESDNTQALRFYQRLGFVHEGTLRAFYKRAHQDHYVDEIVLGLLFSDLAAPAA